MLQPGLPSMVLPQQLLLVFKATGNTQVVPRGIVNISRSGQVIMRASAQQRFCYGAAGVKSAIRNEFEGNKYYLLPGKYDLDIEYRYDGSLGTSTYHASFWYVPLGLLITCGLLLVRAVVAIGAVAAGGTTQAVY